MLNVLMPELPSLTTETIWGILNGEIADATANALVWHCLGYRYDAATQAWDSTLVDRDWGVGDLEPPDFIGDRPAIVKLTRSIPAANKQLLKAIGFQGYQISELVPRKTRRATIANWLLSYMQQQGIPLS